MSLISEALKKAETLSEERPQLLISPDSGNGRFKRWWLLLVVILLGLVFVWRANLKSISMSKPNLYTPDSILKSSSLEENLFTKKQNNQFHLSGIALLEGKRFAIINGDIFQEGDKIKGGPQLVEIGQDEVKLQQEGREIRISLK